MISKKVLQKIYQKEKIISENLAPLGPSDLVIILDGLKPDYNVGKIFRSCEAFGISQVLMINIPFFDTRIAQGCFRKVKTQSFDNFEICYRWIKENNYQLFAFDLKGSQFLHDEVLPLKAAFLFGHEEFGPSFKLEDFPEIKPLKIRQKGQVESLNVSVAASISIYEYNCQHP